MLRNVFQLDKADVPYRILNEVLSLNAQESENGKVWDMKRSLLNEVLSLNAQEFSDTTIRALS